MSGWQTPGEHFGSFNLLWKMALITIKKKKNLLVAVLQVNRFTLIVTLGHLNTDISLAVWPKHVQLLVALKPNQTYPNHLLTFRAPAAQWANRSRLSPWLFSNQQLERAKGEGSQHWFLQAKPLAHVRQVIIRSSCWFLFFICPSQTEHLHLKHKVKSCVGIKTTTFTTSKQKAHLILLTAG